jgi:hypothetical protein
MTHVEINIKRKPNADAMTCITTSLKIAQAINETVYLEMDGYTLSISKNSYEVDIYRMYELEEKLKKK